MLANVLSWLPKGLLECITPSDEFIPIPMKFKESLHLIEYAGEVSFWNGSEMKAMVVEYLGGGDALIFTYGSLVPHRCCTWVSQYILTAE